jgi:hypothetical protein
MEAISLHHSFKDQNKESDKLFFVLILEFHTLHPMHPQLNTHSHLTQQQDGCWTKAQHWPQQKGWITDSFRPFILTF